MRWLAILAVVVACDGVGGAAGADAAPSVDAGEDRVPWAEVCDRTGRMLCSKLRQFNSPPYSCVPYSGSTVQCNQEYGDACCQHTGCDGDSPMTEPRLLDCLQAIDFSSCEDDYAESYSAPPVPPPFAACSF